MNPVRLAILVNGGPHSIERVRAEGLSQNHPPDQRLILTREGSRRETARRWQQALGGFQPSLLYVINTALPGIQVAADWWQRRRVPFVLDTGDVVYEMARSAGTAPWWKLPQLKLGEWLAQRLARTIVVRGTRHREYLAASGHPRVTLIRDGYRQARGIPPAEVKTLRQQLGLEGSFVVGLMGSLVYSRKLDICYGWDLVRALGELRELPVQGLIIGDGPGRAWLEQLAQRHGVADRIKFVGRIPYEQVPLYLSLLDVALSTQTNNLAGQVRTTGKLPEYMATGRFILASRVGEAELVLPEPMLVNYTGTVDAAYPLRLADRLRQLVRNPDELDLRRSLPAQAQKLFSYEVLSRQFDEVVAGTARQ